MRWTIAIQEIPDSYIQQDNYIYSLKRNILKHLSAFVPYLGYEEEQLPRLL